jgi:hypothetical protein
VSKKVWWFNHTVAAIRSTGEHGLDPAYSNFDAGVADITWTSGRRQVVRLGQVGEQWRIVLSRDVPASTNQPSLQ